MFSALSKWILSFSGWTLEGTEHFKIKKSIIIVAPHTSNWDFVLGVLIRSAYKIRSNFIGKKELFRFPLGSIMRWMGGHPVDRKKKNSLVDQIAELYDKHDEFRIALAPEGTRRHTNTLKTGFYFIAQKAEIPILMAGFDFPRKLVQVREPFYPSGDLEKDMEIIRDYFKRFIGKNPELGIS